MASAGELGTTMDSNTCLVSYSEIKTFDEQSHDIEPSILCNLANIFAKHEADTSFGISLIHRHQDVLPGDVIVHSSITPETTVCRIEKFGTKPLYPHSFYLNGQDQFLPFEYSALPTAIPKDEFLQEVASFLRYHNLENVLGVSAVSPLEPPWIENLLPDGQGTILTQKDCEIDISGSDGVITEWAFVADADYTRVRACKACRPHGSGGHRVVD